MSEILRNGSTCLIVLLLAPVLLADDASQTEKTTKKPTKLSVAPLDQIDFPDSRPKWVGSSVEFNDDADTIIVVSGPCETAEESLEELKLMQRAAVSTYISRKTKSPYFDFYPISDEEIERDLAIRSYQGEVMQGGTTRYEHAVELKFTQDKQEAIQHAWKQVEVRNRLGALGVLGRSLIHI